MKKREDCFHDKNYEDIKKKLEAANKNIKHCYIQGPTGPRGEMGTIGPKGEKGDRGEMGPATIDVGTITSVPFEEGASVINVGTKEDVVLNFKIPFGPVGPTGPKGEIGPRGLPGEIGISQAITIDGTETVESGEEAFVQDDFDRNVHHLTFYLPKGETGPIGPQGPAGPAGFAVAMSYAMRFLSFVQDLVLTANMETVIPLSQTGPVFNMDYNSESAIGVKDSGFYLATCYLHATADKDVTLTMGIKADGVNVPSGRVEVQMTSGVACNVSHSIIVALKADEVVNLVAEVPMETKLSFGNNVNSSLCLVKLH